MLLGLAENGFEWLGFGERNDHNDRQRQHSVCLAD